MVVKVCVTVCGSEGVYRCTSDCRQGSAANGFLSVLGWKVSGMGRACTRGGWGMHYGRAGHALGMGGACTRGGRGMH